MTVDQILSLAQDGGVLGLLILVVAGGHKRWWVHGWMYDEARADARFWRDLALRALDLGEAAIENQQPSLDGSDSRTRRRGV